MLIATLKIAMTFRHVSTEKINLKGHNSLLKKRAEYICYERDVSGQTKRKYCVSLTQRPSHCS